MALIYTCVGGRKTRRRAKTERRALKIGDIISFRLENYDGYENGTLMIGIGVEEVQQREEDLLWSNRKDCQDVSVPRNLGLRQFRNLGRQIAQMLCDAAGLEGKLELSRPLRKKWFHLVVKG